MARTVTGATGPSCSDATGSPADGCMDCATHVISNLRSSALCSGITWLSFTAIATSYFGTFCSRFPCVSDALVVVSFRTYTDLSTIAFFASKIGSVADADFIVLSVDDEPTSAAPGKRLLYGD